METEQTDTQQKQKQIYSKLGVKRLTQKLAKQIEENAKTDTERYPNMISLRALQNKEKSLQSQISQLRKKVKRLEKIEKKGYIKLDYRKKQIYDPALRDDPRYFLMCHHRIQDVLSEFTRFA